MIPLLPQEREKMAISFARMHATDVECLAKGTYFLHPDIRGVIDMGGQSTRVSLSRENVRV